MLHDISFFPGVNLYDVSKSHSKNLSSIVDEKEIKGSWGVAEEQTANSTDSVPSNT